MRIIKSYRTITNKTDLSTDGYYLVLRHTCAARDIFINYKAMVAFQFVDLKLK